MATARAGDRLALLDRFACLGPACADTCCRGWDMQVDIEHLARYRREAPGLAADVVAGGSGPVMRRDAVTGACVRLNAGWCGVHKEHGTDFLGDACHFYPRVTRSLGGRPRMTATPSCPEIARLALGSDDGFALAAHGFDRLPNGLREAAPDGVDADAAARIVAAFDGLAADPAVAPARALARIATVARSLTWIPAATWAESLPFLMRSSDERLAPVEAAEDDDVRLLHTLVGLVRATRHKPGPRLIATVEDIQKAMGVMVNWDTLDIWGDSRYAEMRADCATHGAAVRDRVDPILRRWLRLQLALGGFPFAGLGTTPEARATLLGVHFALVRLALVAHAKVHGTLAEEGVVRVVQSLARHLDHLAEPDLWLVLCRDAGWTREARLRGLVEGAAAAPTPATPESVPG